MKQFAVISIISLMLLFSGCTNNPEPGKYDEFAQCLTEKGMEFYGTYTCGHCAKVKRDFGSSFQYVNYIECHPNGVGADTERCIENEIDRYPTFIFEDGSRMSGELSMEQLSQKTGCAMPQIEE